MSGAPTRAEVTADLRRVSERLRNAPIARVAEVGDATRAALQLIADATQGVEERASNTEPRWREVPTLIDSALGDQMAVLGADLMLAVRAVEDSATVWSRAGRRALAEVVGEIARTLKELRFAL